MRFEQVFILGMPRARSKFYQAFINEELLGGIIHETQLLTHKSLRYLGLVLLVKVGLCKAAVPVNYLFERHQSGFFRAQHHRFTAADLNITASDALANDACGPASMLGFFFSVVKERYNVSVVGVRHHMNPLFIPLYRSRVESRGFVIVTRPFSEIFKSKLIWENRGAKHGSVETRIAAFLKLVPVWAAVKVAVLFYGHRDDVSVIHHVDGEDDNQVRNLCRFLGVQYSEGMGDAIGLVDSSHDLASQKPRG
jgi:hypothetical protein